MFFPIHSSEFLYTLSSANFPPPKHPLKEMLKKLIKKTGLLNYINFTKIIKINNQKIKIPVILGLSFNLTENWMISLLSNLLRDNKGTFIDIGVNLGKTLIKVKGIESTRKYIGFEPNPNCIFYVKELINKNKFTDCTIIPVGLFTEDNVLSLECINDSEVDSAASLVKNFRSNSKIYHKILVPVFSFQTINKILNIDKIGIIKIDVEGSELEVVKTLYSILNNKRPIVLLEILPIYSSKNIFRKERQEELEKNFEELDYNYSFFRVEKSDKSAFIGLREIKTIGIHSNLNECDYVVVPNESVEKIQNLV